MVKLVRPQRSYNSPVQSEMIDFSHWKLKAHVHSFQLIFLQEVQHVFLFSAWHIFDNY